jgi:K+ transporter
MLNLPVRTATFVIAVMITILAAAFMRVVTGAPLPVTSAVVILIVIWLFVEGIAWVFGRKR